MRHSQYVVRSIEVEQRSESITFFLFFSGLTQIIRQLNVNSDKSAEILQQVLFFFTKHNLSLLQVPGFEIQAFPFQISSFSEKIHLPDSEKRDVSLEVTCSSLFLRSVKILRITRLMPSKKGRRGMEKKVKEDISCREEEEGFSRFGTWGSGSWRIDEQH